MDTSRINLMASHFRQCAEVKLATLNAAGGTILAVASLGHAAFHRWGNGSSAADAQHLAAEFTSLLRHDFPRTGLPAIALRTDTSYSTARSNDFGLVGVYARLVECLGRSDDVLISINTSANLRNVLANLVVARERGIRTTGLTVAAEGKMAALTDLLLAVSSTRTEYFQETHMTIWHLICQLVEEDLFPSNLSST